MKRVLGSRLKVSGSRFTLWKRLPNRSFLRGLGHVRGLDADFLGASRLQLCTENKQSKLLNEANLHEPKPETLHPKMYLHAWDLAALGIEIHAARLATKDLDIQVLLSGIFRT